MIIWIAFFKLEQGIFLLPLNWPFKCTLTFFRGKKKVKPTETSISRIMILNDNVLIKAIKCMKAKISRKRIKSGLIISKWDLEAQNKDPLCGSFYVNTNQLIFVCDIWNIIDPWSWSFICCIPMIIHNIESFQTGKTKMALEFLVHLNEGSYELWYHLSRSINSFPAKSTSHIHILICTS